MAWGVPTTFVSSLHSQALDLATSDLGFPPISVTNIGLVNQLQGRPNFVVPFFVPTFSPPVSSVAPSLSASRQGFFSPRAIFSTKPTRSAAVVCGVAGFLARPAEDGEPDRFGQVCGTERVALFEHCSNTFRLGSSIVFLMGCWSSSPCVKSQNRVWTILAVRWRPFQCVVSC